jgi:regulator of protease activity HflC (stomatin/prohibitin superfamily)
MDLIELLFWTFIGIVGIIAAGVIIGYIIENYSDNNAAIRKLLIVLVAVIIAIVILTSCIVVIDAGNVGVANTFGNVDSNAWYPGIHIKNPFTAIHSMSVRTQAYTEGNTNTFAVAGLSNEGLPVTLDITMVYHLMPSKAPELYSTVGLDYQSVLFEQAMRSVPRDVIAKYDVKTLYSAGSADSPDRSMIEQELKEGLDTKINTPDRGIVIETVSLRHVGLPKTFTDAIEAKMQMETKIQTKENEIAVQQMEYKRAMVEATQIKDYQNTIAEGISDQFIKWKSLETLEKVGSHGNMVIVTDGQAGMPIILNPKAAA